MAESLINVVNCPMCRMTPDPPITLCKSGHSICSKCAPATNMPCPECGSKMTAMRNHQLEQLISKLQLSARTSCKYTARGCKFTLVKGEKEKHERECKFRVFECEAKKFCGLRCDWKGGYGELLKHFKRAHQQQSWMEFKADAELMVNFEKDTRELQISFDVGQQLFWYKHHVSVDKQKAYWVFQFIGPAKMARHYYYEFEVFHPPPPHFRYYIEPDFDTYTAVFVTPKALVLFPNSISLRFEEIAKKCNSVWCRFLH